MNRAKAKREACWLAARVLEDMFEMGWPRTPEHEGDYAEEDFVRIEAGLRELIVELDNRGYAGPEK